VAEIQTILTKKPSERAPAEQEWKQVGSDRGIKGFSAGPAISIRPANPGFAVLVRYVTRANERHQQKSKLYSGDRRAVAAKNIPEPATPPQPVGLGVSPTRNGAQIESGMPVHEAASHRSAVRARHAVPLQLLHHPIIEIR